MVSWRVGYLQLGIVEWLLAELGWDGLASFAWLRAAVSGYLAQWSDVICVCTCECECVCVCVCECVGKHVTSVACSLCVLIELQRAHACVCVPPTTYYLACTAYLFHIRVADPAQLN